MCRCEDLCLHPELECDGVKHCRRGEDEDPARSAHCSTAALQTPAAVSCCHDEDCCAGAGWSTASGTCTGDSGWPGSSADPSPALIHQWNQKYLI